MDFKKLLNKAMNPDFNSIGFGDVMYDIVRVGGQLSLRTCQVLLTSDSEITLLTIDNRQIKYHKELFNKAFFVNYTKALEEVNKSI